MKSSTTVDPDAARLTKAVEATIGVASDPDTSEPSMRFLCIYRPGIPENETPPSNEEQAAMGALIGDMAKAGVLLGAEGCMSSRFGTRVRLEGNEYSLTDGPFPETKELISGFCLLQVKTKAEAVEWTKRFLALVKCGSSEIRQLYDVPAG